MALRPSMAALIARSRRMIGDPSGTAQHFTDTEIQQNLDVYQVWTRYDRLDTQPTIQPGGKRVWTDFFSKEADWEDDTQLLDATYNILSPDSSDTQTGHWTFTVGISNGVVWVLGKTYDINMSAHDLLMDWAAQLKLGYDFQAQGIQYARSQRIKSLTDLALSYSAKAKPMVARQIRNDLVNTGFAARALADFEVK